MLAVAYGAGVDSTAMLVGMHARGIRPDVILFADVGAEKPGTYSYLPTMQAWCARVGFPQITVVRYEPVRATYRNLEEKCAVNETLPSLAFGFKSCSIVFKREPQDKWMRKHPLAQATWARGERVVKAIGYDASPADARRSKIADDREYHYWYPLREWGWERAECIRQIEAAGLPVPVKSACWFCPASKRHEVEWLAEHHPELLVRGVAMEDRARDGKHGLQSTKGLGRNWAWREVAEARGLVARRALPVVSGAQLSLYDEPLAAE